MRIFLLALLMSLSLPLSAMPAEKAKPAAKQQAPILAKAAEPQRISIAAVANDSIVSTLDVEERVRLVLGTTGIKDTPEIRQRLRAVSLRALIDEKLQLQEAANNGIAVTKEDLAKATAAIEEQRGKPIGSLREHLVANNLPVRSFEDQLTAQISWARLIQKKVRPRIKVSDTEVQQARERLANTGQTREVQLAAILLPVDRPENDESIRKLAEKLVGEIRSGASFEAVAGQFAATSAESGSAEPFWTEPTQLDPAIAEKITKLKPGQIAEPVRTLAGWQIVRLVDVRKGGTTAARADMEVALKEIVLSLKPDADKKEAELLLSVGKQVAKNPGSCIEEGVAGLSDTDSVDIRVTPLRTRLSALPLPLQPVIAGLEVGAASEPFATPEGIKLVMLCEKMELPAETSAQAKTGNLPDPDEVRKALFQQKMELEAMKYLRNIRREAFVDVRKQRE